MKKLFVLLALAAALTAGCAQHQTTQVDEQVLVECRSQADEHHKARYSDDWQTAVQQCLEQRAAKD
ncbi:MAG: hypothetical protein KKE73_16125 [Proteobacteria bacterium]|nr:hypothetical protein [Pseudomonadota bacterium]